MTTTAVADKRAYMTIADAIRACKAEVKKEEQAKEAAMRLETRQRQSQYQLLQSYGNYIYSGTGAMYMAWVAQEKRNFAVGSRS